MTNVTIDHEQLDGYRFSQVLMGIEYEYEYRFAEYEYERRVESEPDAEWRSKIVMKTTSPGAIPAELSRSTAVESASTGRALRSTASPPGTSKGKAPRTLHKPILTFHSAKCMPP